MDELFKLLKEYNTVTGKVHHLLVGEQFGVSIIAFNDRTLEIGYYRYLGLLNTAANEAVNTMQSLIQGVTIAKANKAAGRKALWGEE